MGNVPGGAPRRIAVGMRDPFPKTLTLFVTKICDIDHDKQAASSEKHTYIRVQKLYPIYPAPKGIKNHTLRGRTYLYSPPKVEPPLRGIVIDW